MNHATQQLVRTIIGVIGNIISLGLFLSPAPTFYRIIKKKSVEEFHPWIYVAGVLNCCLWILYGSPTVHPNSTLVWSINSVGLVLYTIYLSVFIWFAPMAKRLQVLGTLVVVGIVMAVIASPTLSLVHSVDKRGDIVGDIAVIFNICLYASPLTVVVKVFKTKSVEFLPFWVCLAGLLNGACWTTYGFIPFDVHLVVGNGIGACLGLFQVGLHVYYGNCCGNRKAIDDDELKKPNKPSEVQLETV
ncbi:OLC1v1012217C1 [Oldenlandia corymbosa var. corymbosa]|uniref:Bidirectional sugar transporter SWEET n=1 Tax=Oldenlandia corymbosa var. corymbosa TaxID=529605 RepID=A0AAV1DXM8_OLDCO|nr:OLC1v1012217C1 [Oldenlandia corymbosa var. corymbosa]